MRRNDLLFMSPGKRVARVLYEKDCESIAFFLERFEQYEEERSPLGFITLLKKPGEEYIAGFRICRLRDLLALLPKKRLDSLQMQGVTLLYLVRDWLAQRSQTAEEGKRISTRDYFAETSFLDRAEHAAGGYTLAVSREDAEHILFYLAPL